MFSFFIYFYFYFFDTMYRQLVAIDTSTTAIQLYFMYLFSKINMHHHNNKQIMLNTNNIET